MTNTNSNNIAPHLGAVSGVRFAKVLYITEMLRPLLGEIQEHAHDLPLPLAEARGHYVTLARLLRDTLFETDDTQLELIMTIDDITMIMHSLLAVADFLDSPDSQVPSELLGDDPRTLEALIGEARDAATLISYSRALTEDMPGPISWAATDE